MQNNIMHTLYSVSVSYNKVWEVQHVVHIKQVNMFTPPLYFTSYEYVPPRQVKNKNSWRKPQNSACKCSFIFEMKEVAHVLQIIPLYLGVSVVGASIRGKDGQGGGGVTLDLSEVSNVGGWRKFTSGWFEVLYKENKFVLPQIDMRYPESRGILLDTSESLWKILGILVLPRIRKRWSDIQ